VGKDYVIIRERCAFPLPRRDIEVDFGNGKVVVRRVDKYCDVVESEDPDVRVGMMLPRITDENRQEFVVLPGIKAHPNTVIPEGFRSHLCYSDRDEPWSVSFRSLEMEGPNNLFIFDFGLDNGNIPVLPILHIETLEVDDPDEYDPNFLWFIVDGAKVCWKGGSNQKDGTIRVERMPSYEENTLPDSVRAVCGLEPLKPQWQIEAEAAGWEPPTKKGGSSEGSTE